MAEFNMRPVKWFIAPDEEDGFSVEETTEGTIKLADWNLCEFELPAGW